MPDLTIRTGFDTHLIEAEPANSRNANAAYPKLRGGDEYRILLQMALSVPKIAGKDVLVATLTGRVHDNWPSQTVTVRGLDTPDWTVENANYGNQPGVTGPTATSGATGVLVAGDSFSVDVTAWAQDVADGITGNYGWRITTSQTTAVSLTRGFESGRTTWTLYVEYVDRPDAPDTLSPAGIIGIAKPVVTVDDYDQLSQIQVQVDATPNSTNPDYDTGLVSVTRPKLDLADTFPLGQAVGVGDTTFNSIANHATTYWRARVKLINGGTSLYGPWVEVTREDKPTIVMDNPSGTDIWDPTPVIKAHLSPAGDVDTRWQVIVTRGSDPTDQLYNSGDALTGADLEHAIPLRWQGHNVMVDDGNYRLVVRAWDRSDRATSQGDKPYAETIIDVTMDVDGTQDPVDGLVAVPYTAGSGYPGVLVAWSRASDPDWFIVRRKSGDGTWKFLALVDVDEFRVNPGEWEWVDYTAVPNVDNLYTVRAVTVVGDENRQSDNSAVGTGFSLVEGVWLRSEFGDVILEGDGIDDFGQTSKRTTFVLPYRDDDVDIITSVGSYGGTFTGLIDSFDGRDVDADREILEEIRLHPTKGLRLVWATESRWVRLIDLTVPPHSSIIPDTDRTHTVKFGFREMPLPDEG